MFKVGIYSKSSFFRFGMRQLVQGQEVVEFDSLPEARKAAAIARPLVLIVHESDILGEDSDEKIDDERLRVVVVAPKFNLDRMTALFSKGVRGYQLESVSPAVMKVALQIVALGEVAVPSTLITSLTGTFKAGEVSTLSVRELVVMRCLARGDCNKEISRSIGITEATTKVHVKAIMRKLGVTNRTQAAVWAVRNGLDRSLVNP